MCMVDPAELSASGVILPLSLNDIKKAVNFHLKK